MTGPGSTFTVKFEKNEQEQDSEEIVLETLLGEGVEKSYEQTIHKKSATGKALVAGTVILFYNTLIK